MGGKDFSKTECQDVPKEEFDEAVQSNSLRRVPKRYELVKVRSEVIGLRLCVRVSGGSR